MTPRRRAGAGLLDVNVLIALAWPNHEHHRAAHAWFEDPTRSAWATTPVTETGFVRVSSNRRALPTTTTPHVARQLLEAMRALPGHVFWPDAVEAVTAHHLALDRLAGHRQVTDAHLLALCSSHHGRLVTFDRGAAGLAERPGQVELLGDTD